jgi:hypothetical protein
MFHIFVTFVSVELSLELILIAGLHHGYLSVWRSAQCNEALPQLPTDLDVLLSSRMVATSSSISSERVRQGLNPRKVNIPTVSDLNPSYPPTTLNL